MLATSAILIERLQAIFSMWSELLASLRCDDLKLRLGALRANSIGEQLWCLGGCRESHLRSLEADRGFAWQCSYPGSPEDLASLSAYLEGTGREILAFLEANTEVSENQVQLILDLLAHEFQHQGQMIRYLYGNHLELPGSWRGFWHLEA